MKDWLDLYLWFIYVLIDQNIHKLIYLDDESEGGEGRGMRIGCVPIFMLIFEFKIWIYLMTQFTNLGKI